MRHNRSLITAAAFGALALNGMTLTYIGTCLPAIQTYLGISIAEAGLLMATIQAGFTFFSLLAGILSDTLRRERIITAGCLLLSGASVLFCLLPSFLVNIGIIALMGAGIGCILSGTNTLLVGFYPARKGAILNIHHIFFGLGCLVGPLLAGYLIAHGSRWHLGFVIMSVLLALLAVLFFIAGGEYHPSSGKDVFGSEVSRLLKDRMFQVILLVNALAMGTQVTILLLGVTFLVEAKGCSLATAGITLSIFSAGIMLGRLLCSRLTMSIDHTTIILTLLWLQMVTLILAWYGETWLAVTAVGLSGLTFSGIYPTSLALSGALFHRVQGSALGILTTMGGIGSIILCWLTGYIADLTNINTGFSVMILACFMALLLFQVNHKALGRRESAG